MDSLTALKIGLLARILTKVAGDGLDMLDENEKAALEAMVRQIPKSGEHSLLDQLTEIVRMLASYPQGLSILLGRVAPPDLVQVNEMILSYRPLYQDQAFSEGGRGAPQAERMILTEETFNAVIERCGGWQHIADVVTDWIRYCPMTWEMVAAHARLVRTKRTRLDGSLLHALAERKRCSPDTIRNTVNAFPGELAQAILYTPVGDNFDLSSVDECRGV